MHVHHAGFHYYIAIIYNYYIVTLICFFFPFIPGYGSIESVRLDYVAFANNRLLLNLWVFGGPPSKLNWWSNSRGTLRNDSEHGMFIIYRPENTNDAVRYAIRFYISGHRPGIYSFSVGNRDTRVSKTAEIDIDGK